MFERLKIENKLIRQLDYSIVLTIVIIVIFSSLNIYSATHIKSGFNPLILQIMWLMIGLITVYIILTVDYTFFANYANVIYWTGIILLILNDFVFPKSVNGADSWMKIGPLPAFQPSEFAKIGLIIMISKQLNDMECNINSIKNFLTLCFYALIPMLLIVKQPDMGMTMVCFFIVLGMFFIAGLNIKVILSGIVGLIILIASVWNSGLIKDYWKVRLTIFLHPQSDELNTGLQLIQSQIGIGSGGIWGKGFLHGTQVAGGFVPFQSTDFIFSVVGEEWGLIGGVLLVIAYGFLIYRIIRISRNAKDAFGSMLCVGTISTLLFSVLINMGMTIGIMPISGLTLPFMSQGGSSMLAYFISIGLVLNVGMRNKKINF
jgi:rod shape determining protein RodA